MRPRLALAAALVGIFSTSALAAPHLERVDDDRPRATVARALHAHPVEEPVVPARDDLERVPAARTEGHPRRDKIISAAGTGAIYVGLYGWLSAAWWMRTTNSSDFQFHDEGWFGANTYAGGADKLGHFWGNYAMTRGIAQILHHGGWSKRGSAAVAGGLSIAFFGFSEIKDGYKQEYGFSYGDMVANTTGCLIGFAMEMVPALDRRIDLKISYKPSQLYLDRLKSDGPFNTPEDYTGQTFLVGYHLGSIGYLQEHASWTRFVDLDVGFNTINYKPIPTDGAIAQQELFIGGSVNLQALADTFVNRRSTAGGMLNFVTEVFQPPFTTLRAGQLDRTGVPVAEGPTARIKE